MNIKSALIISTYRWPEALSLILKSVLVQTVMPNEILIADDGSGEATRKTIEDFKRKIGVPVKHIWHKDLGFRKGEILNKSIAATNADYIIEVDGDCIMEKDFIKDHLSFMKKGIFQYGSRVNIQEKYLMKLFKNGQISFSPFSEGIKKRTRAIRIPVLGCLFFSKSKLSKKIRGCNISFWRDDILAVNGYNEDIEGWGREDSELTVRMLNNGCKGRRLRYKGIVYHIWHKEKSKNKLEENQRIQRLSVQENLIWCKNGIDKYLTSD